MAHEVESMFFVGQRPWHGLGVDLPEAPTTADAIVAAGLDWTVATKTLCLSEDARLDGPRRQIPALATVRESDGRILGVVGPDYRPLQNRDAFAFFDPFLTAKSARLETAGSLRNGQRVWILARIASDPLQVVPGDDVCAYLLLSNAHDGTMAVRVGFTPIRVVCANTLAGAHGSAASKLLKVRHVGDVADTLTEIRQVMDLATREFAASADQWRFLASRAVSVADLEKYVRRVFTPRAVEPTDVDNEKSPAEPSEDRSGSRLINRIVPLFESGRGNDLPGVKGTWWAAYNAVSEYLTHERGRTQDTRLDSLWFGQGVELNRRALTIATELAHAA